MKFENFHEAAEIVKEIERLNLLLSEISDPIRVQLFPLHRGIPIMSIEWGNDSEFRRELGTFVEAIRSEIHAQIGALKLRLETL